MPKAKIILLLIAAASSMSPLIAMDDMPKTLRAFCHRYKQYPSCLYLENLFFCARHKRSDAVTGQYCASTYFDITSESNLEIIIKTIGDKQLWSDQKTADEIALAKGTVAVLENFEDTVPAINTICKNPLNQKHISAACEKLWSEFACAKRKKACSGWREDNVISSTIALQNAFQWSPQKTVDTIKKIMKKLKEESAMQDKSNRKHPRPSDSFAHSTSLTR